MDEWCNCDIDLEYAVYYSDVDEINCVTIQACYCVCNNDSDEDGVCDENENNTLIDELVNTTQLIKTIDVLGRETTKKGIQLHIYDDGYVEKRYIIE